MATRRTRSWRTSMLHGRQCRALLIVMLALLLAPVTGWAQDDEAGQERSVQVVHASPAVGPVDVYIDGAIFLVGLSFGAVSDPIILPTGERQVELAPSGRAREEALVDATVALNPGEAADLALIGPAEDLRIGIYPVDLTPLPPNQARLGAVLGSFDVGPADLAVTGGDLLFPTIEYAGNTEFADVVAGTYDLEVRYGGTETPVLSLAGTVLEPEMVYTLYIVGESALGELQSLVAARPAESVTLVGHPAWIQTGDCAAQSVAETVADLTTVAVSPFAERSGHPNAAVSESSFTTIGVPYATLVEQPHAIVVAAAVDAPATGVACGEVGGTQTVDGSLVVGLRSLPGSTVAGIAVVSPNLLDASLTDVSVFVADGLAGASEAEPAGGDSPVVIGTPVVIGPAAGSDPGEAGATPAAGG